MRCGICVMPILVSTQSEITMSTKTPKLVIVIEGGLITALLANMAIETAGREVA